MAEKIATRKAYGEALVEYAEEYPELPHVSSERSIRISSQVLKNMIRQTIFAVAESDAKPIHTGTLFEIGNGKIRLVSVDGYRLAIREEMVSSEEQDLSFVVPGKALQEVSKLLLTRSPITKRR